MNPGESSSSRQELLDVATRKRLGKLADAPVDVSALLAAVEQQVPRRLAPAQRIRLDLWRWLTPLRAAAAGITFIGLAIVVVLYVSGRPAQASVQSLVKFHEDMNCGMGSCLMANSVDSANAALARQTPGAPRLPEIAQAQPTCCCVHCQGSACMSCLCCRADGERVSMLVGNPRQIRLPSARAQQIGGVCCRVASERGINLCMIEHGDRWVCLIGSLPVERLAQMAGAVRW